MFYIRDNRVVLTDSDADVCGVDEIQSAIRALSELRPQPVATVEEIDEDRYTVEGIDREFKAPPDFVPDIEAWNQDKLTDWKEVPGNVLFTRYPRHAESYCWGCADNNQEPTYEGFRQWLCQLRDME